MNRFVVAEPLWCTGCNTCLAAWFRTCIKRKVYSNTRAWPREDVNTHCPCRVSSL